MTEPLWTFPSVQALAVAHLRANGYPDAQARQPNPLTSGSVRIWRLGGRRRDIIQDEPLLMWHVWHDSNPAAERTCERIRALIGELSNTWISLPSGGGHLTFASEPAGPVENPDPDVALHRWQGQAYVLVRARPDGGL